MAPSRALTATFSDDGNTITGRWEIAEDGHEENRDVTVGQLCSQLCARLTKDFAAPTGSMVPSRRVTTECAWEVAA